MAFADPQSVTISAVTTPLPRTSTQNRKAIYESADGLIVLSADHSESRNRKRHVLRLDHSKVTADPFIPAQNREVSMSNYMVFDVPHVGYSNAEIAAVYEGFELLITASSSALVTKLIGGES